MEVPRCSSQMTRVAYATIHRTPKNPQHIAKVRHKQPTQERIDGRSTTRLQRPVAYVSQVALCHFINRHVTSCLVTNL